MNAHRPTTATTVDAPWAKKGQPLVLAFLAWAFANTPAVAHCVYNYSSFTIRAVAPSFDYSISPNASACCHWTDSDCNPEGGQHTLLNLTIASESGTAESARAVRGPVRDVRFLASADCQYINTLGQTGGYNAVANATHVKVKELVANNRQIRGVVYAGDLTQDTRPVDEFAWYTSSISGYSRFFYEGLGNHDTLIPDNFQWTACAAGIRLSSCVAPAEIREYVRDKKRVTGKSHKSSHGHYSWDWHDVHFVQLNLFPGDSPAPIEDLWLAGGGWDPAPRYSLSYLIDDLATFVRGSGRPVILIHHYGFDDFSKRNGWSRTPGGPQEPWWNEAERLAYWNAIKSYNVIAILTGHIHLDASHTPTYYPFRRPPGATGGPDFIPSFVVGAARSNDNENGLGAFTDIQINGANQMFVRRRDHNGTQRSIHCAIFSGALYVLPDAPSEGAAGWFSAPYPNLANALSAVSTFDPTNGGVDDVDVIDIRSEPGPIEVRIAPASYPAPITWNKPARLVSTGPIGLVRIGGP